MSFLDRFKRKGQEETTPPVSPPKAPEAPPSAPRPTGAGKATKPKPDLAMLKPDPAMQQAPAMAALDAAAAGYNPDLILPKKKEKPAEATRSVAGSTGAANRQGDA